MIWTDNRKTVERRILPEVIKTNLGTYQIFNCFFRSIKKEKVPEVILNTFSYNYFLIFTQKIITTCFGHFCHISLRNLMNRFFHLTSHPTDTYLQLTFQSFIFLFEFLKSFPGHNICTVIKIWKNIRKTEEEVKKKYTTILFLVFPIFSSIHS